MRTTGAVLETELDLPLYSRGKVRDTYELDRDRLLMVATDRLSAFDWVLPTGIPDRNKILTQLSIFWFQRTRDVQKNHLIEANDNNRSIIVRRTKRVDFKCIVQNYLTESA